MTSPDQPNHRLPLLRLMAWAALCCLVPLGCVALAGMDNDYVVGDTGIGGSSTSGTGGSASGTGGSTSGSGGSSSGTGGSSSGTGGSSSGTGGSTSGGPPNLVNSNLIVRYFIDEGASGQPTKDLLDSAPNPLNLVINFDGTNLGYTEVNGNRGLHWTTAGTNARASVLATNTKIQAALTGSGTATMELVIDVDSAGGSEARLSHIGAGTEEGLFTLGWDNSNVQYWMNGVYNVGRWNVSLNTAGRVVLHLVVEILQGEMTQRTRLYVDGVWITPNSATTFPGTNTPFMSPAGRHYVLGNRDVGGRSFQGTLYYAAMYAGALSQADISQNASELLVNDDGF